MNDLEQQVIELLLAGDDPVLAALRLQLRELISTRREVTDVGFFVHFLLSEKATPIPHRPSFAFGDVVARINGLQHGLGFVLFIDKGILSILEGYTYDEPWKNQCQAFTLEYTTGKARDLVAIRTTRGWPGRS